MNSIAQGSKSEPIPPTQPINCQPVGFIRFHGLILLVVEAEGSQYVPVKPINDLVGLDWRSQRAKIQSGDNTVLYGSRKLFSPLFNVVLGGGSDPFTPHGASDEEGDDAENLSLNGERRPDLYIRLDRAQMFMARVNTSRVRSMGNVDAANYLLALQIEWAQALDAYQLHGVAVKQGAMAERKLLGDLMKSRVLAAPREKRAFDRMIADALQELGYPVEIDGQQTLPMEGGAT